MVLTPAGDSSIAELVDLARGLARIDDEEFHRRVDALTAEDRDLVYRIAIALGAQSVRTTPTDHARRPSA